MTTTGLTAAGLLSLSSPVFADNWTDHVAEQPGGISIDTSMPNTTNITQNLDFVKVHGDGDITKDWTVNVKQPNGNSKYVLFDTEADPTKIMGKLNANGQIYIFDQNGVIFGKDSQVNVGSIIASTGTVQDADLKDNDGKLQFTNVDKDATIVLNGEITVKDAGLAGFVAKGVENNGVIKAKMGSVGIGAGKKVTLDFYGDNLVEVDAGDAFKDAMIKNSGTIKAEGGQVALSAQAAKNVVDNVINTDGIIDVSSATVKGGKIVLSGGDYGIVRANGKLKANGVGKGGQIKITGEKLRANASAEMNVTGKDSAIPALTPTEDGTIDISMADYAEFLGTINAGSGTTNIAGKKLVSYGGTYKGGKLAIDTDRVEFKDTTMEKGDLDVKANSIDLVGKVTNANGKILGANRMSSNASTVNVKSSNGSIQQGVDMSKDGGTVNVASGTYLESVNVYKSVSLRGANAGIAGNSSSRGAESIVDPNSPGFNVTANDVTVDGFEITSADTGVYAQNANNVAILNNNIHDIDGHGIHIAGGNGATVSGNLIDTTTTADANVSNKAHGIYLDHISGATIDSNVVRDVAQDGIKDAAGVGNTITNNTIRRAGRIGIFGEGAYDMTVADNTVRNSGLPIFGGITVLGGENQSILRNTISNASGTTGGAGIYLALANGTNRVNGNDVSDIDGTGIYASATNLSVNNNDVTDVNGHGIHVAGGNGAVIRGNVIDTTTTADANVINQAHGIYLDHISNATVENNDITDTAQDGIKDAAGIGNTIRGNDIANAGRIGIFGEGAYDMTVADNTVTDSNLPVFGGITVLGGQNQSILRNTVSNASGTTGGAGIYLALAQGTNRVNGNDVSDIGGTGIYAQATNLTVNNNDVSDVNGHGIHIAGGNGAVIRGNVIDTTTTADANVINQAHGIYLDHISNAVVDNNIVRDAAQDGIKDAAGVGNDITNNTIRRAGRIGIFGEGAYDMLVADNTVRNSGLPVFGGITVLGGENQSILRNTVTNPGNTTGGAGIYLALANGVNLIVDNDVSAINGTGIYAQASGLSVLDNNVTDVNGHGIHVAGGSNAVISRNTVDTTTTADANVSNKAHGIYLDHIGGALVEDNVVTNAAQDGIKDAAGVGNTLTGNTVTDAGRIGIFGEGAYDMTITDNTVTGSGLPVFGGITVLGGQNQSILRNTVSGGTSGAGIYLALANGTNRVNGNDVSDIDGTGIYASATDLRVNNNDVTDVAGHGIEIDHVGGALVRDNTVTNAGRDGIKDASGTGNTIRGNEIVNAGRVGIFGEGAYDMTVVDNTVIGSGLAGFGSITVLGGQNQSILRNTVSDGNADSAGIYLAMANGINRVNGNDVSNVDGHGIYLGGGNGAIIRDNTVDTTTTADANVVNKAHGIFLDHISNATVDGNVVRDAAQDGIKDAAGVGNTITNNTVRRAGRIGIFGEGAYDMTVADNTVRNSNLPIFGGITILGGQNQSILRNTVVNNANAGADAGIYLGLADGINRIVGNTVTINNGGDGIVLANNPGAVRVRRNTVNGNDSARYGIYALGAGNGEIRVRNNVVNDADTGAAFESGVIDLTGNGNTFNGGRVGLRFAPAGGDASVLSLVDNDAPGVEPYDPSVTPTNFGGTIGAQTFNGQSQSYVELANNAFFNPGTPTWLNGLDSTYDGVKPSALPGNVMDDATYDALEQKMFHYVDDATLGVFFFGTPESAGAVTPLALLGDINQEDIFNRFGAFNGDITGLNVRITGLPRIGNPAAGAPTGLTVIQPASAEAGPASVTLASSLNTIETAAGDTTQVINTAYQPTGDLSSIEPASGEQGRSVSTQNCWSDAMSVASNGGTADIVYQGSMAGSLAQASACGTSI